MKLINRYITEKLKVSKEYKQEIDFSWYKFIRLIYENDYVVRLLDVCEYNKPIFKDFYDLPEFTPNTSKPKYRYSTPGGFITALRVEVEDLDYGYLHIMYRLDENEHTKYCIVESFADLKDFLDTELIIKIYDYLKENA